MDDEEDDDDVELEEEEIERRRMMLRQRALQNRLIDKRDIHGFGRTRCSTKVTVQSEGGVSE